jgi:hypothetical protein
MWQPFAEVQDCPDTSPPRTTRFGLDACQVNSVVRFDPAVDGVDEVDGVRATSRCSARFGVWHQAQVVPSFRCPAWNASSVKVPSSWWQACCSAGPRRSPAAGETGGDLLALGAIAIRPPALQTFVVDVAHGTDDVGA